LFAFAVDERRGDYTRYNFGGILTEKKKVVGGAPREWLGHHCSCACKDDE
jgi:hypothetical protein